MPARNIDPHEREVEQHLAAATEFIRKGDGYYAKAADEIIAAQKADPTLSYREIAKQVGKSDDWCRRLVRSRTSASPESGEFKVDWERGSHATQDEIKAGAKRLIAEKPEEVASDIARAMDDPKVAKAVVKQATPRARNQMRKAEREQVREDAEKVPTYVPDEASMEVLSLQDAMRRIGAAYVPEKISDQVTDLLALLATVDDFRRDYGAQVIRAEAADEDTFTLSELLDGVLEDAAGKLAIAFALARGLQPDSQEI